MKLCKSEALAREGLRDAFATDVADTLSFNELTDYIFNFCCSSKSREVQAENEAYWTEADREIDAIFDHAQIFGDIVRDQLKQNQRKRGIDFALIEVNRGQSRKSNGGHYFERSLMNALRHHLGPDFSVEKARKPKGENRPHTIDLIVTSLITGCWVGLCLKNRARERWAQEEHNCMVYGAWFVTRENDLSDNAAKTMAEDWNTLVFVPDRMSYEYPNVRHLSSLPDALRHHLSTNARKAA